MEIRDLWYYTEYRDHTLRHEFGLSDDEIDQVHWFRIEEKRNGLINSFDYEFSSEQHEALKRLTREHGPAKIMRGRNCIFEITTKHEDGQSFAIDLLGNVTDI